MKYAEFLVLGSAVLIAGCSSGGGKQATPTTPGSTTTTFTGASEPVLSASNRARAVGELVRFTANFVPAQKA